MSAIRLAPLGRIGARLRVPGDKSISHRALILNAVAQGSARVTGLAPGLDVRSTASALAALGAEIAPAGEATVTVTGPTSWKARGAVHCGNSGTTVRLLLGALAPRAEGEVVLDGDASLRRRPMDRVARPLALMGAGIVERDAPGRLPLAVHGAPLTGMTHRLEVASAQVKSALLLAGLAAEGATVVVEPFASRDHTERMLRAMGARLEVDGEIRLEPGAIQALDVDVPGDLSSASFFLGLAAAAGEATVEGVGLNPGRTGFLSLLARFGAEVVMEPEGGPAEPVGSVVEPVGNVTVRAGALRGMEVRAEDVPGAIDELPLLAVLATQAGGETRVTGARELRVKESDRIAAIVSGLSAMGAEIEALPDGFVVIGPTPLAGTRLDAAGDHRIAMALAVAASIADGESLLEGAEWVDVSYPGFFEALADCAASTSPSRRSA